MAVYTCKIPTCIDRVGTSAWSKFWETINVHVKSWNDRRKSSMMALLIAYRIPSCVGFTSTRKQPCARHSDCWSNTGKDPIIFCGVIVTWHDRNDWAGRTWPNGWFSHKPVDIFVFPLLWLSVQKGECKLGSVRYTNNVYFSIAVLFISSFDLRWAKQNDGQNNNIKIKSE